MLDRYGLYEMLLAGEGFEAGQTRLELERVQLAKCSLFCTGRPGQGLVDQAGKFDDFQFSFRLSLV